MVTFSNFAIFKSYYTNVSKDAIDDVSNNMNVIKTVINNSDCCYKY